MSMSLFARRCNVPANSGESCMRELQGGMLLRSLPIFAHSARVAIRATCSSRIVGCVIGKSPGRISCVLLRRRVGVCCRPYGRICRI